MEENKRQYFRMLLNQKTVIKALMLDDRTLQITSLRELPGEIVDVSGGGACALCEAEVGDNELLEFSFRIDRDIYNVMGKVVWLKQEASNSYRMGIKFEAMDDDMRANIIKGLNAEIIRRRKM